MMSENTIDQWIIDLVEGDSQVQMNAFNMLEAHGESRMVEPLIQIIRDRNRDAKVRGLSIDILVAYGDPVVNDVLIDTLQDPHPKVRTSAIWGLRDIGGADAIEPLDRVLRHDESPSVRAVAAITLGTLGGKRAVRSLITALSEDQFGFVRACAAESLGVIGDPQAIEPLVFALDDSDEDVRQEAAVKLGEFGDERAVGPLIYSLKDEQAYVQQSAIKSLKQLGTPEALAAVEEWQAQQGGV
jgi:HEAT repeat protein